MLRGLAITLCVVLAPMPTLLAQSKPVTIEGNLTPELLPEEDVWLMVFELTQGLANGKTDAADPDVRTLNNTFLFMSATDVTTFLQVGSVTLAQVSQIEAAGDSATSPETQAQISAQRTQAILQGRDQAQDGLTPKGKAALARFVAIVKHGTNATLPN